MRLCLALALAVALVTTTRAQLRLADESDRAAFRAWFTFIADAQFYAPSTEVTDCAALVRHAYREALRAHSPEWVRRAALPLAPAYPDVRHPPRAGQDAWRLFRVSADPRARFAEFADARTIIRLNTRPLGRETAALRPGDLLHFVQEGQRVPDHLMVFVGRSEFERGQNDWIVYHTGPDAGSPGEVRKVRLSDLLAHPAPRWRPVAGNPAFAGVFRLSAL